MASKKSDLDAMGLAVFVLTTFAAALVVPDLSLSLVGQPDLVLNRLRRVPQNYVDPRPPSTFIRWGPASTPCTTC